MLPPNRVRRNYKGGMGLDLLQAKPDPQDGDCPEDWLASLVEASNPGLPERKSEGLATVAIEGEVHLLRDVIAGDPGHFLGKAHHARKGLETGFLAKLLDSSMRLHIQAHPTREFAKRHYNKPWGKFESYVILDVRPEVDPYIYLGFQRPPDPGEWLRIVTEQDMPAMLACFDKVPVTPGDVWYVPGGLPHALGEGLTVLEVMEPSDLVVRCEFEREGIIVPPPARFMGQEPAQALRIFDHTSWPLEALRDNFKVAPVILNEARGNQESLLIGPGQIDCFEVRKLEVSSEFDYQTDGRFRIGFVHQGSGSVMAGDSEFSLERGDRFLVPAATSQLQFAPNGSPLEIFFCLPGRY